MANALAQYDQPSSGGNALSDVALGSGLAQGAADLQKLYPIWQSQFIDGQTQLQFADWLKQQGVQNPVMPR